jgi:hypothetical protein
MPTTISGRSSAVGVPGVKEAGSQVKKKIPIRINRIVPA